MAMRAQANEAIQRSTSWSRHEREIDNVFDAEWGDVGSAKRRFLNAVVAGRNADVEQLLAEGDSVPAAVASQAVVAAVRAGQLAALDLLLRDPRVDPAAGGNAAMKAAVGSRQVGAFKRLLDDPRTDVTGSHVFCTEKSHAVPEEMPRAVLAHPRFGIAADEGNAFSFAIKTRDVKLLEQLLEDPRIDLAACSGNVIYWLCPIGCESSTGDEDEVGPGGIVSRRDYWFATASWRRLLADPRFDPGAEDNAALFKSVVESNLVALEALLADPRVDPVNPFPRGPIIGFDDGSEDMLASVQLARAAMQDQRAHHSWQGFETPTPDGPDGLEEDSDGDETPDWIEPQEHAADSRLMLVPSVLRSRLQRPDWRGKLADAMWWGWTYFWADAVSEEYARSLNAAGLDGSGSSSDSAADPWADYNFSRDDVSREPDTRSLSALAWRRRARIVAARERALAAESESEAAT